MDPFDEHKQRLADVTREANFELWNAVLTLNGIIASVFSAVAIFEEKIKPMAFLIVAGSVISAALIILNFQSTRDQFRLMGSMSFEELASLTDEQKRKHINTAVRKHEACNWRERISWLIMTAQSLMILALLYFKKP